MSNKKNKNKNKNKDKKGENKFKKNAEKNRMEAAKKRSEDKKKMERNTVYEINESQMKRRQRSLSPIVETPEELNKILKNMNEQESEKAKEKYKSDLKKLIEMNSGVRSNAITMQEALLQSIASKLKNPNNMGEIKQNNDGTLEFVAYSPTGKGAASRTSKNKRKKTNDKQKKRKKSRGGSTKKRRKKKNITRRR
tara:strand:- start:18515 stop:19099 length:585 start_codon:yes stop_codon:yes gene_type:complete